MTLMIAMFIQHKVLMKPYINFLHAISRVK